MKLAKISRAEKERRSTLRAMRILDTPKEERFDRITRLATKLFSVPISTITLIDVDREWHKSYQGLTKRQAPRAISFCSHTINFNKPLIILDARKDKRFYNNPLVTKKPHIRSMQAFL